MLSNGNVIDEEVLQVMYKMQEMWNGANIKNTSDDSIWLHCFYNKALTATLRKSNNIPKDVKHPWRFHEGKNSKHLISRCT